MLLTCRQQLVFVAKRSKKFKKNWSFAGRRADEPHMLALEFFDLVYSPIYRSAWPHMRLALLSVPKYAAVVNNDSSFTKTSTELEYLGAYDMIQLGPELSENSKLFESIHGRSLVDKTKPKSSKDGLNALKLPIALKAFIFENGDMTRFPEPVLCSNRRYYGGRIDLRLPQA
ncbi:hypothetical protein ACOME3_006806 [Neoechinorhynchus agilis]